MDDIWFSDTPLWMDSTTVSQFLDAIEGNGVYIFRLCINFDPSMLHKGQLISKCLFCVFNSSKKRTKKFNLTTIIPQVELFWFVFWKN